MTTTTLTPQIINRAMHDAAELFNADPESQRLGATVTVTGTAPIGRNPGRKTGTGSGTRDGQRVLVDGGWEPEADPADMFEVPSQDDFDPADSGGFRNEFLEAEQLDRIVDALIKAHPSRLGHLAPFRIIVRWKRTGGGTTKPTLGLCQKLSGLARHAMRGHYLVWLAADHLADLYPSTWHIEALLFHQLLHATFDPKTLKPTVRDHDFAGFDAELAVYGAWTNDLFRASEAFTQLPLIDDDDLNPLGDFGRAISGVAA